MAGGALVGHVDEHRPGAHRRGPADRGAQPRAQQEHRAAARQTRRSTIRLKGAIGLKYLQVTPGTSTQALADGATVPVCQTSAEVDLDQVLSMFTPPTRDGVVASTIGFGDGLAGRGATSTTRSARSSRWSTTSARWRATSPHRKTDLGGFFRGLEPFSAARRARRPAAGRPVRQSRHHVPRAGERRRPVPPGLDLADTPPTFQTVIDQSPDDPAVPDRHRGAVRRARARDSRRCRRARRCSPTRSRRPARCRNLPGPPALDRGADESRPAPGDLRRRTRPSRRGSTG